VYSLAVLGQIWLVDTVGPLVEEPARPTIELATRWATATVTAAVGITLAGVVYTAVWHAHWRRSWGRREGMLVIGAGVASYLTLALATVITRAVALLDGQDVVNTLGSPPPSWVVLVMPPVVYATCFARAARSYLEQPGSKPRKPA
jgi:hypothetical protein